MNKSLLLLIVLFILFPVPVFAKIGVGVGTGKIQVDDKLKPGTIYELPPLTVINTGDESSDYEVSVSYHEKQLQLKPAKSWFIFSPQTFHLDPGKVQVVNVKLNLAINTKPGDYFAYLEGHPLKKTQSGSVTIGVAAAAKLYFTVVPANIFYGVYYKIISFWKVYAPWPQIAFFVLALLLVYRFARKYLNIQIGLRKSEGDRTSRDEMRKSRRKRIEE